MRARLLGLLGLGLGGRVAGLGLGVGLLGGALASRLLLLGGGLGGVGVDRALGVGLVALGHGRELGEVDRLARGVRDLGLAERDRERLVAGDLADHRGDLAVLAEDLDELVGVHAVLRRTLHEVLGELVLADLDLLGLGDRVEHDLGLEGLGAGLGDLGAVLVVLEAALGLEVTVHLVLDDAVGDRHVDELDELVDEQVAGLGALAERLVAGDLLREARRELVERVELARDLREVVVGLGKLALLDGGDGDGDLGGLALVVAAEELRLEGGRLAGGERVEGLVDALEQLARAELVRDAAGGVDLGVRRWWRRGRGSRSRRSWRGGRP